MESFLPVILGNFLIWMKNLIDFWLGESFGAISAAGEHAAMPHYDPTPESNRKLNKNETFLIDNGQVVYYTY